MNFKLALIAGGALFATPAFAEDPVVDPNAGDTTDMGGTTDPMAGGEATGMEATTGTTVPPPGAWSRSVVERPYILGKGKIAAYGGYGIARISFNDPITMMSSSVTGDGFYVGGGYGVTDKITAGAQYGFTPGLIGDGDSEIKGEFDIYGEYEIIRDAKLNVTASADFAIDLCGSVDMMGECASELGINAGLGARYTVAPKMAAFTGAPYGPGPVGQHLSISFDGPITFDVPLGFMFQATPELNVHAMTALMNLGISDADTIIFGADYIPLTLGALYSATPNIDVVGTFGLPDLKEAGFDLLTFTVGARWYN